MAKVAVPEPPSLKLGDVASVRVLPLIGAAGVFAYRAPANLVLCMGLFFDFFSGGSRARGRAGP